MILCQHQTHIHTFSCIQTTTTQTKYGCGFLCAACQTNNSPDGVKHCNALKQRISELCKHHLCSFHTHRSHWICHVKCLGEGDRIRNVYSYMEFRTIINWINEKKTSFNCSNESYMYINCLQKVLCARTTRTCKVKTLHLFKNKKSTCLAQTGAVRTTELRTI